MIRLSWRFPHHQMMKKMTRISKTHLHDQNLSNRWWRRKQEFLKPICSIRSIKQMMKKTRRTSQTHLWHQIYQTNDEEDNKNFSNPSAEHQIYITRCWRILQRSEDVEMSFVVWAISETSEWILFFWLAEWILCSLPLQEMIRQSCSTWKKLPECKSTNKLWLFISVTVVVANIF